MKDAEILKVDLGKNSCSVVGLDAAGRVVFRRRMRREGIVALAAKLPGCVIAMEACCGAHHLGLLLVAQGHEVRLMSPEYVRPYVKSQKNDDRDAEAIAGAATRPTMRFVALKTEAQLDVQVLHRVRDRLVGQRTSLMNQVRSILLDLGIVVPQGRRSLLNVLEALSQEADRRGVGAHVRVLLDDMCDQWRALDARIKALDDEFAEVARDDPAARRLATIPGIGVMHATALVAAVGDGHTFSRGRDLSGWLRDRQAEAARYYQARQQVSAQADYPGRTSRFALADEDSDATWRLAARFAGPGAWQHGCRSVGEQIGSDRLSAVAQRDRLRRRRARSEVGRDRLATTTRRRQP